jgi:YegS/Rv2252/BmrU family lipid kinase
MSAETLHLFLNPVAGRGRTARREPRIRQILERCGKPVVVHHSRGVGDLESQVRQIAVDGERLLVVAGGDGTIHEATNGIMSGGHPASLGVVPGGTGNDFAKASDIPLDWELATKQLAARLATATAGRRVDIGRLNDRFFANGAGIGFDARVTEIARSYRAPIGDLVYLLAIFRGMAEGIETPRMQLTTDELIWDGPITLANIASGPWVGGMFHIAPMAHNGDGIFDLVIAAPVTRLRILSLLPKLMRGKHFQEKEITHVQMTKLLIEADEPVSSHLDGEVQAPQCRFEISLLPGALQLL